MREFILEFHGKPEMTETATVAMCLQKKSRVHLLLGASLQDQNTNQEPLKSSRAQRAKGPYHNPYPIVRGKKFPRVNVSIVNQQKATYKGERSHQNTPQTILCL